AAKFAGKGAGMFAGAAFFGLFGLGFLLTALAWGLVALGLATWLAFLIVAVLLFIGAAVLALVGKKALAHADPTPKRAISEAQQTIATIKGQS
ncbi:MAG TPA: phage holin family protein, partial [Dermatophilaceae bacterium]|nr:phage holin family protein [Dermatophilaceae bacterium]